MVTSEFNQPIADQYFVSCDWSAASFRLTYVDAYSGMTTSGISGSVGIKTVHRLWNLYTGSLNKIDFYLSLLEKHIKTLETKVRANLSPCRIIIAEMASSSVGIKELPYGRLPISLKSPNLHVEKLAKNQTLPNEVYLISSLQSSHDVMHGEETQILGLKYKSGLVSGTCLLAGTHSKHVIIKNRNITDFNTFMTGEFFELISTQSILSQSISINESTSISKDFGQGVQQSDDGNLLLSLFEMRTQYLLQNKGHLVNADYLSGLLIGAELKDLATNKSAEILIFGINRLQKRYVCAVLKLNARCADANPEEDITVLGHLIILQQIIH